MEIVLTLAVSLLVFGAVFAATLLLPRVSLSGGRGGRLFAAREEDARRALDELFLHGYTPRQVTIATLAATAVTFLLARYLTGNFAVASVLAALVFFSPRFVFAWLRSRRLAKIEEQLPDAVRQIAHSTKAGMSLVQAVEEASEGMLPPVSQELALIAREVELGADLGTALENARRRVPTRGFGLVVTSLVINRQKGGNLPETMDRIGGALREIWRLEQKLITATAEGRRATWLLSSMPFVIFAMVSIAEPRIPELLTSSWMGFGVVFLAFLFYGSGLWWLLRVLRLDV